MQKSKTKSRNMKNKTGWEQRNGQGPRFNNTGSLNNGVFMISDSGDSLFQKPAVDFDAIFSDIFGGFTCK
jgi:hypothetical protein